MPRVLLMGYEPESVDFSDPALPPGLNAERVVKGLAADLHRMRERGWDAESLLFRPDEDVERVILDRLSGAPWDCIVIGAGVRMSSRHVPVFERVLNAVRRVAPQTPIAFNSGPDSSGDAAARWLAPQAG